MKQIPLTQGKVALVDDDKYEGLMQWKWYAHKARTVGFYAARYSSRKEGKPHLIYMHRQILGLKFGDKQNTDHQNRNKLDNRQRNIRICTHRENMLNQKSRVNTTSKFKGVYWNNYAKKWASKIRVDGVMKHLGYWAIEEVAALRYDMVAIREHGEFACLNFN